MIMGYHHVSWQRFDKPCASLKLLTQEIISTGANQFILNGLISELEPDLCSSLGKQFSAGPVVKEGGEKKFNRPLGGG